MGPCSFGLIPWILVPCLSFLASCPIFWYLFPEKWDPREAKNALYSLSHKPSILLKKRCWEEVKIKVVKLTNLINNTKIKALNYSDDVDVITSIYKGAIDDSKYIWMDNRG